MGFYLKSQHISSIIFIFLFVDNEHFIGFSLLLFLLEENNNKKKVKECN